MWLLLILLLADSCLSQIDQFRNLRSSNPDTSSDDCRLSSDVSQLAKSVLCSVEQRRWFIEKGSLQKDMCLIGENRCSSKRVVPTVEMVDVSKPPPIAKNKYYQALATIAEDLVPKTWWRNGFDSNYFLLSHNDSELPIKLLDVKLSWNKRLKNMHQCVSRQVFIRRSFSLQNATEDSSLLKSKCSYESPNFQKFWKLWSTDEFRGGEFTKEKKPSWSPRKKDGDNIRKAAIAVLQDILDEYGGIWTGCFRLAKAHNCRLSLAAAAYVIALHNLADVAWLSQQVRVRTTAKKSNVKNDIIVGYMLSSLGRALLHGHFDTAGNFATSIWKLRISDFIVLQSAYLQLYIDTYGAIYNQQLNDYIPLAFPPEFEVTTKSEWRHLSTKVEPVYTSLRNLMFTESSNLIDFGPYLPLVAFPEVRNIVSANSQRRVLIDVGANGFFASPKYLLDSYAAFLPFTHAIMIEPEPHFSATVPPAYADRYNISFLQIYAEVGTNSATDIVQLIPTVVNKNDFVVLKFDVDPNRYAQGPTMEWGFLFSLMKHPKVASLVDELYIELHFHYPALYWQHYHSNWEALDMFRYLRANGMIVHSWP